MSENNILVRMLGGLLALLLLLILLALGYFVVAGLTYVICLAFGLTWNWLVPVGVIAIIFLVRLGLNAIFRKE